MLQSLHGPEMAIFRIYFGMQLWLFLLRAHPPVHWCSKVAFWGEDFQSVRVDLNAYFVTVMALVELTIECYWS